VLGTSVRTFVADGLLPVFFFVAGLEVRRALVTGELRERRRAALPVLAAFCGMAAPALVFTVVAWGAPGAGRGWAVPVATDVAFALGVLAFTGQRCPPSLRVLLLSLAVVDDVGAIVLVAVLFAGGVHLTVVAVALALVTPARLGARLEHRLQPWSAGVVVPLFAFTAAGVPLTGLGRTFTDRVAVAVFAGLVLGKPLGIAGGVALGTRLGWVTRPDGVRPYDVLLLGALGGVGFTVSLLLADLAFTGARAEHARTAVLAASVVSGLLAAALGRLRRDDVGTVAP
jgi:NhaA family Na+:H+ antiporter